MGMRAFALGQSAGVREKEVESCSYGGYSPSLFTVCARWLPMLIVWAARRVLIPIRKLWKLFGMPISEVGTLDQVPLAFCSAEITKRLKAAVPNFTM
jgi:hypothetical protein